MKEIVIINIYLNIWGNNIFCIFIYVNVYYAKIRNTFDA